MRAAVASPFEKPKNAEKSVGGFLFRNNEFLDFGLFADLGADVVELCSSNLTAAEHFDAFDTRRVEREYSLDADTVGILPHGEGFADTSVLDGDHQAFISLDSLSFTFHNLEVYTNCITDVENGKFTLDLFGLYGLQYVHSIPLHQSIPSAIYPQLRADPFWLEARGGRQQSWQDWL